MRRIILPGVLAGLTLALLVSTSAFGIGPRARLVTLHDAEGHSLGTVRLSAIGLTAVQVRASVRGLTPGFHGFHIHTVGTCEAPFASAGTHLNLHGASHPNHSGDMPVLYVTDDGKGKAQFITNRFAIGDLFDDDGSAIIVHSNPDNYANIPMDRYDPDADATTLNTGDAGARVGCGVIEAAGGV